MADPENDNEFDNYSLTNDEYTSTEQESNSFVSTSSSRSLNSIRIHKKRKKERKKFCMGVF